jgi:hypothetical protein
MQVVLQAASRVHADRGVSPKNRLKQATSLELELFGIVRFLPFCVSMGHLVVPPCCKERTVVQQLPSHRCAAR